MCGGGLWSHREIIGDVVRPGELGACARGMRIVLLLFLAALFGNHFEISPKSTHQTLCARSHGKPSRAEAGSVCRSHLRVRLLSWPLHFLQCLVCSGALDWGPGQGGVSEDGCTALP